MFGNMKISTRFTLLLAVVFLVGSLLGGLALWNILSRRAQDQFTSNGLVMLSLMDSVRKYTTQDVSPLLQDQLAQSSTFIPESVPAFSAREVFEGFRQTPSQTDFSKYFYKEATFNPTNPRDRADSFELDLQYRMQADPNLKQVSDFRRKDSGSVFYIARPLRMTNASCLHCHSTPEEAPKQLLATYGSEGGFGWQLGQVVAVQIIYVPSDEVNAVTLQSFWWIMGIYILVFAIVILLINTLLRRDVISSIRVLGDLAVKVSNDDLAETDLNSPFLMRIVRRKDELGSLATVFTRMVSEVQVRTQHLKEQVQQLQIQIDEARRQKDVSEIVESEFFQNLQKRAKKERQRRGDQMEMAEVGLAEPDGRQEAALPGSAEPEERPLETGVCWNCGSPNRPGAHFCAQCGASLSAAPAHHFNAGEVPGRDGSGALPG